MAIVPTAYQSDPPTLAPARHKEKRAVPGRNWFNHPTGVESAHDREVFDARSVDLEPVVLVKVLGPLEATAGNGDPIDLGGPRQRAVLARLLTAGGDVVAIDRLIHDLWSGSEPPRALASLIVQ